MIVKYNQLIIDQVKKNLGAICKVKCQLEQMKGGGYGCKIHDSSDECLAWESLQLLNEPAL